MQLRLKPEQYSFIKYLTSLSGDQNRETLAVLRRGLSDQPAANLNLYRFIARRVPDFDRETKREGVYYMTAALYAFHPMQTDQGNFGNHMAQASAKRTDQEAAERRFTSLLNARLSEINSPLRQAMAILKQLEQPVNWPLLFADLLVWDHPDKITQRSWANGFWSFDRTLTSEENSNLFIENDKEN